MASPPDTTAITRMTTSDTAKETIAAFLSPRPGANGSLSPSPTR
jgi:hypothetical protein